MGNESKRIVLYHGFTPFEGDALETKPLGGSEAAIIHMMRELALLGHEPTVICKCEKPGKFSGVNFVNLSRARDILEGQGADIFISQTSLDVFQFNIKAKLKVFWTGGNHDVRVIQPMADKKIQNNIDYFFFVSAWQAEGFNSKFGIDRAKIFITRNGFDPLLFKDGVKKEKYRMIYFSSPSRGLDVLLDMFPKIRKRFKDAELHIYSDYEFYGQKRGEGAREHPEIFKKIDQPGVRSFGNVKREEMAREVQKAYIMAYPTAFRETSCMAAIEAQAAGTVPVTSKLAGLTETVLDSKTGVLVGGNSHSLFYKWKFVNKVIELFENEDKWRALSEAGKSRMKEDFTWSKIAHEWDQFFKEKLK